MMKKILSIALISLATTTAYADVVDINVTQNVPNTQWNFDGKQVTSYRFHDQTNQAMQFTISLDSHAPGPVAIYCWDKNAPPPPTEEIQPGSTFKCTATDVIKVTADDFAKIYSGYYSINLSDLAK